MEPQQTTTTETQPPVTPTAAAPAAAPATTPEISHNTIMGVLSYLGPLVLIPYLTTLDDPFVKYHVKQGIVLFGLEIIIYVLSSMFLFSGFYQLVSLLNLATLIFTILGIVNVVQGKEKTLPLIGHFSDKIKI